MTAQFWVLFNQSKCNFWVILSFIDCQNYFQGEIPLKLSNWMLKISFIFRSWAFNLLLLHSITNLIKINQKFIRSWSKSLQAGANITNHKSAATNTILRGKQSRDSFIDWSNDWGRCHSIADNFFLLITACCPRCWANSANPRGH